MLFGGPGRQLRSVYISRSAGSEAEREIHSHCDTHIENGNLISQFSFFQKAEWANNCQLSVRLGVTYDLL